MAIRRSVAGSGDDDGGGPLAEAAETEAAVASPSSLAEKLSGFDAGQVLENLRSGTLGARGELYVAGQFGLIAAVLAGWPPIASTIGGTVLLVGGLATVAVSVLDLGTDSLTPFLPPTRNGSLKTTGIYAHVRHPLYAGLVATMAGISLATDSVDRLAGTAALFALVNAKADLEEGYLTESYPDDYPEYTVRFARPRTPVRNPGRRCFCRSGSRLFSFSRLLL